MISLWTEKRKGSLINAHGSLHTVRLIINVLKEERRHMFSTFCPNLNSSKSEDMTHNVQGKQHFRASFIPGFEAQLAVIACSLP